MTFAREKEYLDFIGSQATEEDGGWSKEVWDAAWNASHLHAMAEIDNLTKRIKLLEEEVAFVEHGYTTKGEGK